jgi:hypothetical protein
MKVGDRVTFRIKSTLTGEHRIKDELVGRVGVITRACDYSPTSWWVDFGITIGDAKEFWHEEANMFLVSTPARRLVDYTLDI